jgi:hypothetical protein
MDNKFYELGCKTGLLNYIDHETPRFYFINANADLDDFDAFCAEITEEYAAEIERLRGACKNASSYISVRDQFAIAALPVAAKSEGRLLSDDIARMAYELADAMIKARAALGEG